MVMPQANLSRTFSIRTVRQEEWPDFREVSLQMLADAPQAYLETLSEAQARTPEQWQALVAQLCDISQGGAFFAEDQAGICGCVRVVTDPRLPPEAVMASELWVAPHQRGKGVGRSLMDAATAWAQSFGAAQIILGVTGSNTSVLAFYQRLGYQDTGRRLTLPSNTTLEIKILGRALKPR